jgi:hypothetical protein
MSRNALLVGLATFALLTPAAQAKFYDLSATKIAKEAILLGDNIRVNSDQWKRTMYSYGGFSDAVIYTNDRYGVVITFNVMDQCILSNSNKMSDCITGQATVSINNLSDAWDLSDAETSYIGICADNMPQQKPSSHEMGDDVKNQISKRLGQLLLDRNH